VLLAIVLVLGNLEIAWGHAAMSASMQIPICEMVTTCPYNNTATCIQGHTIAIPAVTPLTGDLHPLWIALPVLPDAADLISDSGTVIFTKHFNRAVSSGPPLHLRFCSFLK